MRVLFITSYYKPAYVYGGPTRAISASCEGLCQAGAEVTVFTTNANGAERLDVPTSRPVDIGGVEVWYYRLTGGRRLMYSVELGSACRERIKDYDLAVVESVWGYVAMTASRACRRAGVPYVVALRGQLLPWSLSQKYWKKWLCLRLFAHRALDFAAGLHCTDQSEADALAVLDFRAPAFVVPDSVDISRMGNLPNRGGLRQQLGIADTAYLLLFVGRLHHKKRPDIAIAALAGARAASHDAHLIFAGPDEENLSPSLKSKATALGCIDRVHFAGLLRGEALLQAYADADLLIMPSEPRSENFGMSAAEAMAAGLPILVSDGVPIGKWAAEAGAGLSVSCSASAFAEATVDLLSAPARLNKMGAQGAALAKRRFDRATVATHMLKHYRSILDTGAPIIYSDSKLEIQ